MTDYPDLDDASYDSALIRLREQFAREQDGNIKARALKVNDPEFLLGRLADEKEALLVTRVTRKSLEGTPFLLVNKKKDDDDPVQAFAVVEFEQEENTVENLEALGNRVAGVDELSRTDFGKGGEKAGDALYVLKLSLIDKLPQPVALKGPPPGRRFGGDVDLDRDRLKEAFHIRGAHWEPVPDGGTCPVSHPNKLDGPDGGPRCYTDSAAEALKALRERQSESGADVGAFLKKLADEKGLTFAEIAEGSGMAPSTVSQVLNGKVNRPDDNCLKGFAKYFNISEERLFKMRESSASQFREQASERTGQQIAPSGLHEHPHPPNGIHTHLGSPPNSGGHEHERNPGSGAHRHRDGDPIDGFHLGDPTDEGAHVHILANREKVPALWEWYRKVVGAHFPKHQWLEGHKVTWVAELQEDGTFGEARQTEQGDWDMHGLWAMHSAGANAKQHQAVHLDPETRLVQVFYEFENDERREATAEDFEKEVAWFDENLPFPREEVTKALGEDGEFQEAGVRFIGNCAGAEVAFTMREVSLDSARKIASDLCEANPEMAISICSGDFSSTVGPRRQADRNGAVRLRGSLVGDLFANSRGLVANLRTTDLREGTPVEDDQWAVAIEGGNRHARFLHLPNLSSEDLKAFVGEMALSNPDRVFHLAKATERDKSAGLVFRIAASMNSEG